MTRRHASVVVLGIALLVSACGSSPGGSDDSGLVSAPDATIGSQAPATSPPSNQGGGIGGAIKVIAEAPGQANDAACAIEVQTLTTASEAFDALTGAEPTSQNDLFEAGLIREQSPWFEITADGVITPVPGSPCT
jgi:hypothetical protein